MSPKNKKKLNILRRKLDKVDNKLIDIIKIRTNLVKEVVKLKEYKNENAQAWKDILGGADFMIVEEEQAYNDITTYTEEPQ